MRFIIWSTGGKLWQYSFKANWIALTFPEPFFFQGEWKAAILFQPLFFLFLFFVLVALAGLFFSFHLEFSKSYSGLECWARNLIRLEFKPLFLSGLKLFGENQKSLKMWFLKIFFKEQFYLICNGGLVVSSPNSCQSELSSTPPLT